MAFSSSFIASSNLAVSDTISTVSAELRTFKPPSKMANGLPEAKPSAIFPAPSATPAN